MAISARCACGETVTVGDRQAGSSVTCPACQADVAIPAKEAPASTIRAGRGRMLASRRPRFCRNHPDRPAPHTCAACMALLCDDCAGESSAQYWCQEHLPVARTHTPATHSGKGGPMKVDYTQLGGVDPALAEKEARQRAEAERARARGPLGLGRLRDPGGWMSRENALKLALALALLLGAVLGILTQLFEERTLPWTILYAVIVCLVFWRARPRDLGSDLTVTLLLLVVFLVLGHALRYKVQHVFALRGIHDPGAAPELDVRAARAYLSDLVTRAPDASAREERRVLYNEAIRDGDSPVEYILTALRSGADTQAPAPDDAEEGGLDPLGRYINEAADAIDAYAQMSPDAIREAHGYTSSLFVYYWRIGGLPVLLLEIMVLVAAAYAAVRLP